MIYTLKLQLDYIDRDIHRNLPIAGGFFQKFIEHKTIKIDGDFEDILIKLWHCIKAVSVEDFEDIYEKEFNISKFTLEVNGSKMDWEQLVEFLKPKNE